MPSNTIVFAVGLLALPLALLASPNQPAVSALLPVAAPLETSIGGHPLEAAPVPNVELPGVAPVDRVAGPGSRATAAGPINSTPFSATPSGTLSGGGIDGSQRDRTLSPAGLVETTPNLGR